MDGREGIELLAADLRDAGFLNVRVIRHEEEEKWELRYDSPADLTKLKAPRVDLGD